MPCAALEAGFDHSPQDGRYYFHCFNHKNESAVIHHGESYARTDMRIIPQDGEGNYPDPALCEWHYRQCVLMRIRAYTVNMAIAP
jgi:hypothetical protein